MKSFDFIFKPDGSVTIQNIKGIDKEDASCLDLTKPYVDKMEDKKNPAETIMLTDEQKTELGLNDNAF